jgi:hypothetical protein
MPLLQTLEIHEVITTQAVDIQRASLKRQVRDVANGARNFAMGLRRRMNALDARDAQSRVGKGALGDAATGTEGAELEGDAVLAGATEGNAGTGLEVAESAEEAAGG